MSAPSALYRQLAAAVTKSTATGSLKVFGQVGVALFVYPLVIRAEGAEALGVWVLLLVTVGYGGLVHVGMGTLISKTVAESRDEAPLGEALTGALVLTVVVALLVQLSMPLFTSTGPSPFGGVSVAVVELVLAAVVLRLWAAIYEAVLTGLQQNYLVQLAQFAQAAAFVVLALTLSHPSILHVLAVAFALSYLLEFVIVVVLLAIFDARTVTTLPTLRPARLAPFLQQVGPYASVEVSLLAREPLLKVVISLCCGSAMVGVYELATKVPSTIRQAFVLGLSALLPAVARLRGSGDVPIARLGTTALHYLLFSAIGALLLYGLNAEVVLDLWLGELPEGVLELTWILTVWWAIATLNVPAWWLGMGMGAVRTNANIVGGHLVFTAALAGLVLVTEVDAVELVLLWVAAGTLMQVVLYWALQRQTRLIAPIYLSPSTAKAMGIFAGVSAVTSIAMLASSRMAFFSTQTLFVTTGVYLALAFTLGRRFIARELVST